MHLPDFSPHLLHTIEPPATDPNAPADDISFKETDSPNLDMNPILDSGSQQVHEPKPSGALVRDIPVHKLQCPNADLLSFWKKTTVADMMYQSPFLDLNAPPKYVTFEPGTCTGVPVVVGLVPSLQ